MPGLIKKTLWPCYAATLLVLALISLWGITGALGGGGLTFRGFNFHIFIPVVSFIAGLVLGLKDARAKMLYPLFAGGLTCLAFFIIFTPPIGLRTFVISFALPLLAAFTGIGLGVLLRRVRWLRRAAKGVIIAGIIILTIHIVHAATLDRIINYMEISFSSPNLPPEMSGYRIAFITDPHTISEGRLQGVVDELNERDLDLLLLGGDFSWDMAHMQRTVEILAQTQTTNGIFGVEGNHDDHIYLFAAMRANGMTPLSNSGLHIREGFFLAGVEDLWNRNPNIALALEGAQPGDFVLLLSHNPDVSMRQDTTAVDIILSGHTHGGQITFFGIWAPYFTVMRYFTPYGQRFRAGWAGSRDGTPVFVSRGIGEYLPRVFARPDVVLLTLYSQADAL